MSLVYSSEIGTALDISDHITGTGDYFFTHTTMGLEIGYYDDGNDGRFYYKRLRPNQVSNKRFLIRCSCLPDFVDDIQSKCSSDLGISRLAGYNDVLFNITGEQFNCLYPRICEYNLFKDNYIQWNDNLAQYKDQFDCSKKCDECIANYIGQELFKGAAGGDYIFIDNNTEDDCLENSENNSEEASQQPRISALSIEALVDTKCLKPDKNESIQDLCDTVRRVERERIEKVNLRSHNLITAIEKFRQFVMVLPVARASYVNSIGLLLDLLRIYLPMGAQSDLYMNGKVIYEYSYYLSVSIYTALRRIVYLEKLNADNPNIGYDETSQRLSEFLAQQIRQGVDAINVFARLTQAVNLQFFSSANYELFTRLNAQKLLIAYSEYMFELSESYRNGGKRQLRVLVDPHITSIATESYRLHPHDYTDRLLPEIKGFDEHIVQELEGIKLADYNLDDYHIHPVLIRFPGFEQYLRVYETLPNLHHEYMHFQHYYSDDEKQNRNEIVIRLVCCSVADIMITNLLDRAAINIGSVYGTPYYQEWRNIFANKLVEGFKTNMAVTQIGIRKNSFFEN